ncbi:tetratricopeptide repeat protein [Aequorivita sp. KMM 9714]|uniref:tetratricopeptide repeat protein n=1 Tax=Aequorivita sp. KMM 9714 TaxID=2707173 RepID=UPI0013E9D533|nr:tetratricopeptide repeat protein [Aequorivita sp. KMM 9714]NGX83975.1 tetratricopeptide repeat protein [Aequorivita sp. KMM 9714]
MKKRILITGLAFVSAISFGQKKEIKKAEKALKSNDFKEALAYLNEAEPLLGTVDNDMKAQFYATRGNALLGNGVAADHSKLMGAAQAFAQALELDPKLESQLAASLQNLRAGLINGAIKDQNAGNFELATEKLYTSYTVSKDMDDLYFAASNSVNAKDYKSALKYYQMLLDAGYTGETKEFVATDKDSGEVIPFETEQSRSLALKSGQYIKPEIRVTASRKGEILRNMTLIYLEQGDNDKAISVMKAAREENPDDIYLMRAEADMSYKMGDITRYNKIMNQIAATDPDNPEIYFNMGVASAELGDTDKALEHYNRALELKPDYEAALINIAVLKLSTEDALVEEMNSLGNSRADNIRYDELKEQRADIYRATVPYLTKAMELNPNNPDVVRTLMNIYGQLADDANYQKMKAKLATLEK